MEYASNSERSADGSAIAIARAPARIRRSINRARVKRGLSPVLSRRDYATLAEAAVAAEAAAMAADTRGGAGVWVNQGGRLVPAGAPSRSARAPAAPRRQLVPYRVVLLPVFGDAGEGFREHLGPRSFGDASSLNASRAWSLRLEHDGPALANAGERLRAVDSEIGPVFVWEPDPRGPLTPEIVNAFESNGGMLGVSVGMKIVNSRPSRFSPGATFVTAADLRHIALLVDPRDRPVYRCALAMLRRSQWRDDPADLEDHIAAVIREARFRDARARWGR